MNNLLQKATSDEYFKNFMDIFEIWKKIYKKKKKFSEDFQKLRTVTPIFIIFPEE